MKVRDIKKIVSDISSNYEDSEYIDSLSFKNNICIEIVDSNNKALTVQNRGCLINPESNREYFVSRDKFLRSGESVFEYQTTSKFKSETLVYGKKISNSVYVFVITPLEPLDSTISILSSQLIYVTIGTLILSFIVAYFISKRISKPIVKINKSARNILNDYNVSFDTDSNILEIDELSTTLNNTVLELSKTENLRRELMANVSHDLKTPLTMIKAYSEMARDLNSNNKSKRTENLNVIIDEADRLNLLVNDILELSRVQSNIDKLNIEAFDLVDFINDILSRYKYLEAEGYNFKFKYDEINFVRADKKRLEQVMYNLINNAINHVGSDKCVFINVINTDDGVRVEVRDNGSGISSDDLNYIWDKYYKVDKSYTREVVGSGIGLSIVKNILINHGFLYGVDSKINKGTTFWFVIR